MKAAIVVPFAAALLLASMRSPVLSSPRMAHAMMRCDRACDLKAAMRKLWEDHITWTRVYIIDALAGLPDTDKVAARLLKNQEDIGNAIKPYYGEAAGNKLTAFLKDHVLIAAAIVRAAKAGDDARVAAEQKRWSGNADDIAAFLSGANPNWSRARVRDMLQKHLDLTTQQAVARLHQDWDADIKAYDENHEHMLMFSDALSGGVIKQFPAKFSS